jgi:predicted RNA polymerase sigma factor
MRTARNRATDRIRRDRALTSKLGLLAAADRDEVPMTTATFPDERLELIFTCCHPALAVEAQVAPTLRTLGGLTTDEIARASWCRSPRWRSGWSGPRAKSRRPGRAEFLRRLGRADEARDAYRRARDLSDDGAERRFLERRLTELAGPADPAGQGQAQGWAGTGG